MAAALRGVRSRGLPTTAITRADFPLPGLAPRLAALVEEARTGLGFFLLTGLPPDRFGDKPHRRARGLAVAEEAGLAVVEPADDGELAKVLDGPSLVLAAGPAGIELLPASMWKEIDSIEVLADFNAAEPLGIEDTKADDEFEERDGKRVLGALAIGGPKMKVHKACIRRLFESNDAILNADGVYEIAKELG